MSKRLPAFFFPSLLFPVARVPASQTHDDPASNRLRSSAGRREQYTRTQVEGKGKGRDHVQASVGSEIQAPGIFSRALCCAVLCCAVPCCTKPEREPGHGYRQRSASRFQHDGYGVIASLTPSRLPFPSSYHRCRPGRPSRAAGSGRASS
jgi:hypothetical protein